SLAGRIGAETQLEQERRRFERTLDAQRQTAESTLEKEREKWNLVLRTELIAWESLRRRTFQGINEFRALFESQILSYRSERAWRIMLAVRKAYTLLVRRKFRGILPFLEWSIGSALGSRRHSNLDEFEPTFASLQNYVPTEELSFPRMEPPPPKPRPRVQLPKADGRYDVIVLPIFDFDFRFQRPQQIAMQFARAGHRVFWVSPARMLPHSSPEAYELIQVRDNIWETR